MPRKRKSDQQTPTETPTASTDQPAVSTAAAAEPSVAEPAVVEANGDGQAFADRVGPKKEWVAPADPFGIAKDNVAGVRLFESKRDRQMAIKFGAGRPEDKPSQTVIDRMKEAGYRWNPANRIWTHPIGGDSAMTTRIDAEKLYQEVRQMIRQEKGIDNDQGVPF